MRRIHPKVNRKLLHDSVLTVQDDDEMLHDSICGKASDDTYLSGDSLLMFGSVSKIAAKIIDRGDDETGFGDR